MNWTQTQNPCPAAPCGAHSPFGYDLSKMLNDGFNILLRNLAPCHTNFVGLGCSVVVEIMWFFWENVKVDQHAYEYDDER